MKVYIFDLNVGLDPYGIFTAVAHSENEAWEHIKEEYGELDDWDFKRWDCDYEVTVLSVDEEAVYGHWIES